MEAVMYSSKTDLWSTPQDLFDKLDAEFHFNLDVCALPENAKCERYFTPEQDGLAQEWSGTCWCNPPYGRNIGKWVRHGLLSSLTGSTVVMLLPARTDTKWFHDYIYTHGEIRFLKGRLKFGGGIELGAFPIYGCHFQGGDLMPRVKPLTGPQFESRWKEWEERIVSEYGMLLTTAQLGKVIGMSSYDKIKRWAEAEGVEAVPIGNRKKWDSRSLAKALDRARFRAIS